MISLRPILKVRNKIRAKHKSRQPADSEDKTPRAAEEAEDGDDESFVEELRRQGQYLE